MMRKDEGCTLWNDLAPLSCQIILIWGDKNCRCKCTRGLLCSVSYFCALVFGSVPFNFNLWM